MDAKHGQTADDLEAMGRPEAKMVQFRANADWKEKLEEVYRSREVRRARAGEDVNAINWSSFNRNIWELGLRIQLSSVARRLLHDGIPPKKVSEVTGISPGYVELLQQSQILPKPAVALQLNAPVRKGKRLQKQASTVMFQFWAPVAWLSRVEAIERFLEISDPGSDVPEQALNWSSIHRSIFEEGLREYLTDAALAFLRKDGPVDRVADLTGLDEEYVQLLAGQRSPPPPSRGHMQHNRVLHEEELDDEPIEDADPIDPDKAVRDILRSLQ